MEIKYSNKIGLINAGELKNTLSNNFVIKFKVMIG